ncbi:MAG: S9 family peptidase, partial [Thermoprotei archaeon]
MGKLLDYEDLVHIRLVSSPEVDPGGRRVLFVVTRMNMEKDRYESNIWLYEVDRGVYEAVTSGPSDRCPRWAPDGERFAFISRRMLREEEKGAEIWIGRVGGGEPRHLITFPLGVNAIEWSPDGERLVVVAPEGKPEEDVKRIEDLPVWFNGVGYVYNIDTHLYIVDARSGEKERVTEGRVNVRAAKWSPDGDRIAYLVSRDRLKPYLVDLYVYDVREGKHTKIVEGFTAWDLDWSPDGEYIAFLGHKRPRGLTSHNRIWVVPAEGGEPRCLTCELDRNTRNTMNSDVRGPSCAPSLRWGEDKWIYFLVTNGGVVELYRVSLRSPPQRFIGFEKGIVDEFSISRRAETVAFTYMDPKHPKELYIHRRRRTERVTEFNTFFLSRVELSEPRHFTFTASDGVSIDGWVLPPPRMEEGSKVPWVLYIHGGPKTAYGWSFTEEFHLLAAKGFAVVYCNPRGSDGYGEEFADIRCRYG